MLFDTEDKATLNRVNDAMRAIDPDIWVKCSLRDIPADTERIVIDGVRFESNLSYLASMGFSFWHVISATEIRLTRLRHRGQAFTLERDGIHSGEHEFLSFPFSNTIINDGEMGALHQQIDVIICGP
jgi:hypothetical protein